MENPSGLLKSVLDEELKHNLQLYQITDDILREKDDVFCEKYWEEILRIMDSKDIRDKDDFEDCSLKEIAYRVAEKMARQKLAEG